MPHATGPGRHDEAIGTKSSRRTEVHEVVGPEREQVHCDEDDRQRSQKLVHVEDPRGHTLAPDERVESASPQRMLAVTTAHAMSPAERATYHDKFALMTAAVGDHEPASIL